MDIIDNNKLIAEFMGSEYKNFPYKDRDTGDIIDCYMWTEPENGYPKDMNITPPSSLSTAFMIENFSYHKSWDWLMPVVEKARQIKFYDSERLVSNIDKSLLKLDLIATYRNLVDFIKWYNQQGS